MEIRKLLYATDLEKANFSEVERLMVLRKLGLEEVIFLNPGGTEDWGRRVADYGLKSKTFARERPLLSEILDAARQEGISMIAASLKRGTNKLFGSPIKNLLRSSPVPVIILNKNAQAIGHADKGVFHHVIYPTDWSPLSEAVLKYLLNFREIIEMMEIVNVINRKLSVREMRILKKKLMETRKIFLDEGIDAETHVYAGKTSEEIMLAARDYDATCIVMGTSCKSLLQEIFSRSCSYRVAEEAVIPTLAIPTYIPTTASSLRTRRALSRRIREGVE